MRRKSIFLSALMLLLVISIFAGNTRAVSAEDGSSDPESAAKVTVGASDYESLYLRVYPNGNSIVYMSADKGANWTEVEGSKGVDTEGREYIEMDISWASPTANVKLVFKGNEKDEETECILPKQSSSFTVKFDKVNGDFNMTNGTDATIFWWRKASDYEWRSVPFDIAAGEYKDFLSTVESMRYKGAKLVFRVGQTPGTDADNMGSRPGKEIKVSIPKYSNAPNIKLNLTKLTLNTKDTMEYTTDLAGGRWSKCEKNMELSDVAPEVFVNGGAGAASVTVYFRVAQTEKRAASRIGCITFPAQTSGPSVGTAGTDVSCSMEQSSGNCSIKFLTASASSPMEYCVITPSNTFEPAKSKWKTVKGNKTVVLKGKSAPDGTVVYFRFKGTAENVKKGIDFKLPSEYTTYTIKGE